MPPRWEHSVRLIPNGLASDAEAKEFAGLVNHPVMKIINGEVPYEIAVLNEGGEKINSIGKALSP
jgi:hypothetical protein